MTEQPKGDEPWWAARKLLRAARAGTLATNDGSGQPYASLVTPATAADGSVLMLLSGLSPHTRHLRAEPRCALLVQGAPTGPNPQTAPRLTVTGRAEPESDPALKARWVTLHPYAAFYADLGDFQLWRLRAEAGQFIGGFASAHRLRGDALRPDPEAARAIKDAQAGILGHVNDDHADAIARIAKAAGGANGGDAAWRMVAVDPDGCDLAAVAAAATGPDEMAAVPGAVLRIPWSAPVQDSGGVRWELVALTRGARGG